MMQRIRNLVSVLIVLIILLLVALAMLFGGSSTQSVIGIYSIKSRGVEIELSLDGDGSFSQKIKMPDGETSTAEGVWKAVKSGDRIYLNAQDFLLPDICGPRKEEISLRRTEISYSFFRSFFGQQRIIFCSDGRFLRKK